MDNKRIGENIKSMRLNKGLSQTELAKICNITAQAVSRWERGESIPDISSLENLSTLFGVSINEIINSNLEIKKINIKVLDLFILTILAFVFVIFVFPFNAYGDYASGYRIVFSGFDGELVFSLRLSFFGYVSLLLVSIFTLTGVFSKNRGTLSLTCILIFITIVNNGIAVSQSMISVESISFLVGASVLLLVINIYEFLLSLFKNRNNINNINTEKFSLIIISSMLLVYVMFSIYFVFFYEGYPRNAWWIYISIGTFALSLILFILSIIINKRKLIMDIIVLTLPMIGVFSSYLVYALFIDEYVYSDDFFITLLIELILAIPLVLVIYKRKNS